MKRRQKRSYKEISTKGKVSIPGDTARADEAFGPFPSPARLPSLHVCSMEASMCRVLQKKTVALPQAGVNFNSESNVVVSKGSRGGQASVILRQTHALPRTYT